MKEYYRKRLNKYYFKTQYDKYKNTRIITMRLSKNTEGNKRCLIR